MSETLHAGRSYRASLHATDGVINDNSKRSISIRINTSDYGRIKAVARRLRVRESDVFRFLMKIGLAEIAGLFEGRGTPAEFIASIAPRSAEFVEHFDLNAQRLDQLINAGAPDGSPRIAPEDLELITMSTLPPRFLALRLEEILGRPVEPADAALELQRYLRDKYCTPAPAAET